MMQRRQKQQGLFTRLAERKKKIPNTVLTWNIEVNILYRNSTVKSSSVKISYQKSPIENKFIVHQSL